MSILVHKGLVPVMPCDCLVTSELNQKMTSVGTSDFEGDRNTSDELVLAIWLPSYQWPEPKNSFDTSDFEGDRDTSDKLVRY